MISRIRMIVALAIALAGGALTPPASQAQGYLLFSSEFYYGTRGTIFEMDREGNLQYREEYQLGGECANVTASPDGRMVIVSGGWAYPSMSIFFIGGDGSIAPPVGLNNPKNVSYSPFYNPVGFHHTLPLFYAGYIPISVLPLQHISTTN